MTTAALIPARGGSQSIPRKNIRELCGRPMLSYTIEHAVRSATVKEWYVSTEDDEVAEVAYKWGCPVIDRPPELSEDDVPTRAVEEHFLEHVDCDVLVTLHPTSPLRTSDDIDGTVSKLSEAAEARSVTVPDAHPNVLLAEDENGLLEPYTDDSLHDRTPRQQWPTVYRDNGAVWARKVGSRADRIAYHEMPPERSVDIDTPLDWKIAEMLMREKEG